MSCFCGVSVICYSFGWCVLLVAGWLLCVVSCLLFVVGCKLFVVCYTVSFVVCCAWCVVCRVVCVVGLSYVVVCFHYLLFGACCVVVWCLPLYIYSPHISFGGRWFCVA